MADLQPTPGHYLLAGIDAVLAQLNHPPGRAVHGLVDELRTALARTAACGDTCRVRAAADGVRLAASLLLAGSVEDASPVLRGARTELLRRPASGRPAHC